MKPKHASQWYTTEPPSTDRPPATYTRPVHPASYATLRIQQRTSRSFEASAPPTILCDWLRDRGFRPIAKSKNPGEWARLARGRTPEGKPAQLVILYASGSVLCQGSGALIAAQLLSSICEAPPATACMFDSIADVDQNGGRE